MTSITPSNVIHRVSILLLATILFVDSAAAASLDTSLNDLSKRIHNYLTSHGIQHVRVGAFFGPPGSGAGVALRNELTKQLENEGLKVTKRATTEVRGEFVANLDPEGPPAVGIHTKLVDHRGTELVDFRFRPDDVDNPEDVTRLLSTTVDLQVEKESAASRTELLGPREAQLRERIAKPSFHQISPSITAASETSPYRVEVLLRDGTDLTPVPLENFDGQAYVDLPEGREYVVRLYNDSDIDVGVKLTIDGVNSLELTEIEGYRKLGMWLVKAHERGTIDGWHLQNDRSLGFRVANAEDSEAATLGRNEGDIGTITASFFPAWSGDEIPQEELFGRVRGGRFTVPGKEHESDYTEARRNFGRTLLAAVSVRYEKPDPPADLPDGLAQVKK